MQTSQNFLAVDLGAESGRVMMGQFDGSQLKTSELHRFTNAPVWLPDGLHWDVLRLWTEIKQGITMAVQRHGDTFAGLGLDTWGVDFALLDQDGALIGNPYHYRDARTDGMVEAAFQRVPREEIFGQTGIQFMQLNTLYQLLSMVTNRSPALEIADTFLTMPDLFNYWLTGRRVNEFTNATTTQCYNPQQADWARSMLSTLGIPSHIFAEIVPPGTVLAELRPEVVRETGATGLPVIAPACHDTGSAVAAVPVKPDSRETTAWISSGTWSIMGVSVAKPVINDQSLAFNLTNEGGVANTFRLSKNIMGLWLVQECRRSWANQGSSYSYDELTDMAAAAAPLTAIIDPDDANFFKPDTIDKPMPARIRAYCRRTNQPAPADKGAVIRCALESIALKYRSVLQRLEAILGHRLRTLHIIGGGSQNQLLNQLTADATKRPVIAGPVEATAIGNILMQISAVAEVDSPLQRNEIVRRSFPLTTYEPTGGDIWDEAHYRFSQLDKYPKGL